MEDESGVCQAHYQFMVCSVCTDSHALKNPHGNPIGQSQSHQWLTVPLCIHDQINLSSSSCVS